jgi:hypothetical protein
VAKRTRGVGSTSAYRPGQAPTRRPAPTTSGSPRPGVQPPAAIPGAAPRPSASEASLVITGLPEETHTAVATTAVANTHPPMGAVHSHQRGHVKVKPTSALAARASQEYVYVGEDLRHIAKVGITLSVVMIVLWLVVVVANVFGIY